MIVLRSTNRGSPMPDRAPGGFLDGVFDRTLANLRSAWREIAGSAGAAAAAPPARAAAERALRTALLPPRVPLLRQFNALPEGVKFLVDRRAELIAMGNGDAALRSLADDLRDLLANWFDIGFLELQRITSDSPASLLEELMAYEAVHQNRRWTD